MRRWAAARPKDAANVKCSIQRKDCPIAKVPVFISSAGCVYICDIWLGVGTPEIIVQWFTAGVARQLRYSVKLCDVSTASWDGRFDPA